MAWGLIIAGILVSLLWLATLILLAPEGWQDEDGFHVGKPDGEG